LIDIVLRKDNSIEKDIALRQLALKGQNSDSWFSKLDEISEKYSLNSLHDLEGFELALAVFLSNFPVFVFHFVLSS
jgi:hypothetical protein